MFRLEAEIEFHGKRQVEAENARSEALRLC